MSKYLYSLGLMSGTSLDGVDASIIKSDGEQFLEIIDDIYLKYDDHFRARLKKTIEAHSPIYKKNPCKIRESKFKSKSHMVGAALNLKRR